MEERIDIEKTFRLLILRQTIIYVPLFFCLLSGGRGKGEKILGTWFLDRQSLFFLLES